jgi:proteasome lid subunit RPN8/RPN11
MFGDRVNQDAVQHAADEFPRESVGLVIDGIYERQENVAENPLDRFAIAANTVVKLASEGRKLEAVIHSHPGGLDEPTEDDMKSQMSTAVPWGIVVAGRAPFWFGDQAPIQPLENRVFRYGVTDCYSVVRDWYRLKGITIKDYPRSNNWWLQGKNMYEELYSDAGFHILEHDAEIKEGDIALMRVGQGFEALNHAAVYVGNDCILHHLASRLSRIEPLNRWKNYVRCWVRR